ncbi:unnamed protein product [Rhizoctonia solani]|uniref:Protein F37C4,5 [Caenorhabditis elegans] n=1 Tax=Rhizoctonia solani TaxID=456999 RepID=A0A8H2X760_9AGAM|nr:unnamed protein product [Rhizoctonia solani]
MLTDRSSNRVHVNAAEQDDYIEAVTVFQSNRAEVKRRVPIELKQGQNHIHIERLPTCIDENSIRVDGTGTAVIFDVVYHRPAPTGPNQDRREVIQVALQQLEALKKERDITTEQSELLSSYGKTLDSKTINTDAVQQFLDMFVPRQVATAKRIQELDVQISAAQEEVDKVRQAAYTDTQGKKRSAKITVTVLAEVDGAAELILTYVVYNAHWKPLYDVRSSIANSPEEPSTVALHYRASITQSTGENWPDVALTLSTASPQLGSSIPKLTSWKIGFPAPPPPLLPANVHSFSQAQQMESTPPGRVKTKRVVMSPMLPSGMAPPGMVLRQAHVASAGVLSTSFGIPGRSDIPSDGGSHKVVITVLDLKAELEWICVPREKESTFLTCKVVNTSEFTLLHGEASVFMDNNFVSKSQIEFVLPKDSFKVSLGVDSGLRVTYPPAKVLNRTSQSGFAFMSKEKQSVSTHSQRIIIRNSRTSPVSALRVLDHIPVSTDAQIVVKVVSPRGLESPIVGTSPTSLESGSTQEKPWNEVQKGVKARWATSDIGGEGAVEWSCDIAPSNEIELELAWEVSAPASQPWRNV